ncbi:hypothetical protein KFE25_000166 [Diacronema lutheri]|uniref:Hexosyltransferase n=2 Tax=Diacronema lutheri TaxID=2081491 RepID=A0A8J5XCC1_DIALT|nr:hypothetical protein KFE25_000166 [Diacronema lutheri]
MARPAEVGGAFLLLAVLLSVMRLLFSTARTSPALSSGSIVGQSADAAALIEELRLLRADVGKLHDVLAGRAPAGPAGGALAQHASQSTALAVGTPIPVLGKRDGSVLMAVITNPSHIKERAELRAFYKERFPEEQGKVRVVFVMGNNYYLGNPPKPLTAETKELLKEVMAESSKEGDIVWVDGREALPHVGKATEKSAAWWQTAPSLGNYGFYCKSDDDSLIHLSRLRRDLEDVGESALYGYVAFRGWKPNYKFQACGIDVRPYMVEAALQGRDFNRDENCTDSVGPFPYAGGNLVCMGQVLARQIAGDRHFHGFVAKAHERNDQGIKCKSPLECARQPFNIHMWHHEDAGISYNLFRSIVRGGLKNVRVVKIQQWVHIQHWLRDNVTEPIPLVVIHNLKGLKQLQSVISSWRTDLGPWPFESERAACKPCSQLWHWKWARSCASGEGDACDSFVEFDPNDVYECCVKSYPPDVMERMSAEEALRAMAERAARVKREAEAREAKAAKEAAAKAAREKREARDAAKQAAREQAALRALGKGGGAASNATRS